MSSEFLASWWKNFRGRCILSHTPVLCGTASWVKPEIQISVAKTVHLKKAFWPKRCVLCIPASAFSAVQSIKV